MMTFMQFMEMRAAEGLWLNDKNAVVGLSRIAPPTPPKKTRPTTPPKIKSPHVPKTCEGSLDQLHQNVDALGKLGIGLLPPEKEDLQRLIDKQKNQVTVTKNPSPGQERSTRGTPPEDPACPISGAAVPSARARGPERPTSATSRTPPS